MTIAVQELKPQQKSQKYKYAVFILTHGRPDSVITYETLRNAGYTGHIYLIVDSDDACKQQYIDKYKGQVIIFNKSDYQDKFDIMDNFDGRKVIVYARNACYDIARSLNIDYFFEYEDDYINFNYRWAEKDELKGRVIRSKFDGLLTSMIDCLNKTNIDVLAFAQGGDFIGGLQSFKYINFKRKAMNTMLFKVSKDSSKDIKFIGRMNDDVNTYLTYGKTGTLFMQLAKVVMVQGETQSAIGGNTEVYLKYGTYVKSFYSVMVSPSCCKISMMGRTDYRIHHKINWNTAVPKLLSESIKK